MSDLDKLIAAVEAGEEGYIVDALAAKAPEIGDDYAGSVRIAHSRGDLNAALRLHEALLPGAHWSIAEDDDYGFCGKVFCNGWHHEHSKIASRAWLLAILRALKARDGK